MSAAQSSTILKSPSYFEKERSRQYHHKRVSRVPSTPAPEWQVECRLEDLKTGSRVAAEVGAES